MKLAMDNQPTNPTTPNPTPTPFTPETPPPVAAAPESTSAPTPTPAPAPFSELPPMGTMQIGVPAGATGDGQGLPPATTPPPAPVTPQPVPTTYGDNHTPAKQRNKNILIIVFSIVGLFVIAGIILAIYIISGNRTLSCEYTETENNITVHNEWTVYFVAHHVENGKLYQKITFPTKVPNLYVEQYRKTLKQEFGSDYDSLNVYSDGDKSIIAEGTISVNHLTQVGKSYDETKKIMTDEGMTCKDN